MLCVLILFAMIMMFGVLLPVALRSAHYNNNYTQAAAIAQHKIDRLRINGFDKIRYAILISSTPNAEVDPGGNDAQMRFTQADGLVVHPVTGAPGYFPAGTRGTIYVENYPKGATGPAVNAKLVTVEIRWPAFAGHPGGSVVANTIVNQAPYPN